MSTFVETYRLAPATPRRPLSRHQQKLREQAARRKQARDGVFQALAAERRRDPAPTTLPTEITNGQ